MYLPESWIKVISNEILDIRDGTHDTPKYVDEKIYPLVTSKNLKMAKLTLKTSNIFRPTILCKFPKDQRLILVMFYLQ
jgi:hypothetical protein